MKNSDVARLLEIVVSSTDIHYLQDREVWKYVTSVRKKTPSGRVPTYTFISHYGWRADVTNEEVTYRKDRTVIVRKVEELPVVVQEMRILTLE